MTCIEHLRLKHPKWTEDQLHDYTRSYCPWEVGIDYPPEKVCRDSRCSACWYTDIPEPEKIKKENDIMPTDSINRTKKTKAELLEELEQANQNVRDLKNEIKNLERYKQYEDMADEIKALHTAFMNSGFTNEQAFDLLKTMTQAVIPTALSSIDVCPRYNG